MLADLKGQRVELAKRPLQLAPQTITQYIHVLHELVGHANSGMFMGPKSKLHTPLRYDHHTHRGNAAIRVGRDYTV